MYPFQMAHQAGFRADIGAVFRAYWIATLVRRQVGVDEEEGGAEEEEGGGHGALWVD